MKEVQEPETDYEKGNVQKLLLIPKNTLLVSSSLIHSWLNIDP